MPGRPKVSLKSASKATYYRRRKELVNKHFKRSRITQNSLGIPKEHLSVQNYLDNTLNRSENVAVNEYSLANDHLDDLDSFKNYSGSDDCPSFCSSENESSSSNEIYEERRKSDNLNDVNLNLINTLLDMYVIDNITNSQLTKIIKLVNAALNNKEQIKYFPKSIYQLKNFYELNLSKNFSFVTRCCNFSVKNFKSMDKIKCGDCGADYTIRNILAKKNYSFRFSITEMLKILLNYFDLSYSYPGKIFEKFLNLKKDICSLTIFIDGVRMPFGKFQLYNLFVKVNNLDTDVYTKSFLLSAFVGDSKPLVNFYLDDIIVEINHLFDNGIFVKKYNKVIYPVVTVNLFDLVARHQFLCHISFNTTYGCVRCLAKGEQIKTTKGHSHIYLPEENAELRTLDYHEGIFKLLDSGAQPPLSGVKEKSPITEIKYQDYLTSSIPEPMHLFGGILKRNFESFLNCRSYRCFVKKSEILENRIKLFNKFTYNNIFKRRIENFNEIPNNKWKTNQIFQFFMFMFPVVFENIIDKDLYIHNLILIYIIHNLWSKSEEEINVDFIEKLIDVYSILIKEFYPLNVHTPNNHQLAKHLIESYKNHGKFSLNNAFLFEHFNGVTTKQVKSSFGVLEQISERSELLFKKQIKSKIFVKSRDFKTNSKSQKITQIQNDYFFVTSAKLNGESKDHFIMTTNDEFYKILDFFKVNDLIYFRGQKFEIVNNFSVNLDCLDLGEQYEEYLIDIQDRLNFDYIYNVNLTQQILNLPVQNIKEKVLFCPNFDSNSDKILDQNKGLLFRNVLEFHN